MLVGTDIGDGASLFRGGLADDYPAKVCEGMLGKGLEDRDVGSLGGSALADRGNLNREIPLHVIHSKAVLEVEATRDELPDFLISLQLDRLVSDEVDDFVLGQRRYGIRVRAFFFDLDSVLAD